MKILQPPPRATFARSMRRAAYICILAALATFGIPDRVYAAEPSSVPRQGEDPHPSETPHQIIVALAQRVYAIGETTVSVTQALEAEKTAAGRIREYAVGASTNGLVETDADGQTPLIAAALNGYPQVAAALLETQVVRERIDDRDRKGGSAWIYANMALRESIGACNPSVFVSVFAWEPVMVNQFFYLQAAENPYLAVRRLLESKGARGTLQEAKRFWVDQCKREEASTKEKIAQSSDVLDTAIAAGTEALSRFMVELQQKSQRQMAPSQGKVPDAIRR
jgi:hypothetical protein